MSFLQSLAQQHPGMEHLSVWPRSVTHNAALSEADTMDFVHTLNQQWRSLHHFDLALCGAESHWVATWIQNLQLVALRDWRFRLSYNAINDRLDPIAPMMPCPSTLVGLHTLHMILGNRVLPDGLRAWRTWNELSLRDIRITYSDVGMYLLWDVACLMRASRHCIRSATIENQAPNPTAVDGKATAHTFQLPLCTCLRTFRLHHPITMCSIHRFLDMMPSSVYCLEVWIADPCDGPPQTLRIPPSVKELRIHIPRLCSIALSNVGWLGHAPTAWHVQHAQHRAVLESAVCRVV